MEDKQIQNDPAVKIQSKLIGELNFELIKAERGELKLELKKIVENVMEIVYYKALDQGDRGVVHLDIARVYKRGYMAAEKCGFANQEKQVPPVPREKQENQAVMNFLLSGFQIHIGKYVKIQQKNFTETLDVS